MQTNQTIYIAHTQNNITLLVTAKPTLYKSTFAQLLSKKLLY